MKGTEINRILKREFANYLPQFEIELIELTSMGFKIQKVIGDNVATTGFRKYNYAKGISFGGGGIHLLHKEVESLVFPLIIKYKLWDTIKEPKQSDVTLGSNNETAFEKELAVYPSTIIIATEEDLMKFFRGFKYYIEGYFLPWLEKYNKLEEVNEFINRSSMSEVLDSFAAPFPTQLYRAMVVAGYCNNHEKVKELKDECLRLFEYCKTKDSYTPDRIKDLYDSLDELSGLIKNLHIHVE